MCQYCHKKIKRLKSIIAKNNGINYCSRECGNKDKNEKRLNSFDSTNYRRNAFKSYPNKCCICGYDEEIQILEVHHLDEDRSNNNINNLRILCPNCHKKITLHLYSFEELFNNKH
jgi:5-methylcytosine-specific restriction endonuclease McrA